MVPPVMILILILHIVAVLSKLTVFLVIPRLDSVASVRTFLVRYRPFERTADVVLWITGLLLLYFARWSMLRQTWMIVSIALYLLVFIAIRFGLTRELNRISDSKKLLATEELKRLRVNNWCVGLLAVGLLAVIAYLMMTQP